MAYLFIFLSATGIETIASLSVGVIIWSCAIVASALIYLHTTFYISLTRKIDFGSYIQALGDNFFQSCLDGVNKACLGRSLSLFPFAGSVKGSHREAYFNGYRAAYQSMRDPTQFNALMLLLQNECNRRSADQATAFLKLGYVGDYQAGITPQPNPAANMRANIVMSVLFSVLMAVCLMLGFFRAM